MLSSASSVRGESILAHSDLDMSWNIQKEKKGDTKVFETEKMWQL